MPTRSLSSQIIKDPDQGLPTLPEDISPALEKAVRTVKYTFPRRFLRFDTIHQDSSSPWATSPCLIFA